MTVTGTNGNDFLRVRPGDPNIDGLAGNDTLIGGNASDNMFGRQHDDQIFGGGARDFIAGAEGNDTLHGQGGSDSILGDTSFNVGNDFIDGGSGNDTIDGGQGNDIIIGGPGRDALFGGAGGDQFIINRLSDGGDFIAGFNSSEGSKLRISRDGFGASSISDFTYNDQTDKLSFRGQEFISFARDTSFNVNRDIVLF